MEIEIIDGGDGNDYDCVQAIKTFKHKDYCCPFCSHGETIKLKVFTEYRGHLLGTYIRAYLECYEKCFAYGLFERSGLHGYTDEEKVSEIIKEGIRVFEKLITHSQKNSVFVMVH